MGLALACSILFAGSVTSGVAFQNGHSPKPGEMKTNPTDGLRYIWIPPGKFTEGCSPGDKECYLDEFPTRPITLTRGFWLGQTEVTQAAFEKVMEYNPSVFDGATLPVDMVTWDEADSYCREIKGRLPTEAEWEWAARAGTTGSRYGKLDDIAWYSEEQRFHHASGGEEKTQRIRVVRHAGKCGRVDV